MLNAAERSVAALAERDNLLAIQHDMHEYHGDLTEHHRPEYRTSDVSWFMHPVTYISDTLSLNRFAACYDTHRTMQF